MEIDFHCKQKLEHFKENMYSLPVFNNANQCLLKYYSYKCMGLFSYFMSLTVTDVNMTFQSVTATATGAFDFCGC